MKDLLPNFDRWIDEFAWSSDSQTIYFVAADRGEAPIFSLSAPFEERDVVKLSSQTTLEVSQITGTGEFSNLVPSPSGQYLIATKMTISSPAKIVLLDTKMVGHQLAETTGMPHRIALPSTVPEVPITHLNDSLLAQLDLPKITPFWFRGALGTRVEGFLLKPPAFDPAKKYPLKFLIHGGPEGNWGNGWSYRWNPELMAAGGYVVVMINPRGSTGYGQQFTEQVGGDW